MAGVESESRFLWNIIKDILILPVTFILVFFRKREFKDLFNPFSDLFRFVFEPKATISLILINVAVYFFSVFFMAQETVLKFALYPSDLLTFNFMPFITSGFFHANLLHLAGNMIALFIFGRVVERKMGAWKTALIYFGALIISGIFTCLIHLLILHDNTPGLGASGAIMGLVSAAILIDPFYITYELLIPLPVMVVGWLTIYADISGVINPVEDGIGHFAHLGGFISVALLIFLLSKEERSSMKKGLLINIGTLVLIGLVYFVVRRFFG